MISEKNNFSYKLREILRFKPVFLRLRNHFHIKPHNTWEKDNLNADKWDCFCIKT